MKNLIKTLLNIFQKNYYSGLVIEWIITLEKNSEAKSIYEKNMEIKSSKLDDFKKSSVAKEIQQVFLMQNF